MTRFWRRRQQQNVILQLAFFAATTRRGEARQQRRAPADPVFVLHARSIAAASALRLLIARALSSDGEERKFADHKAFARVRGRVFEGQSRDCSTVGA